ncbi:protein phosphatase CheZ [Caenispirillum bisanense]|uniref:Chemotaxis protein CheZ n=1 Tax=Caenispirillum bisanense TaxID=414052 RepID=A0A286GX81_9PROT|nr:protein phosphatase CheZ [Caenispirillum bisanense]SOE00140.1 chemotaxis protein CheZ [Caenispirillum bisanense]
MAGAVVDEALQARLAEIRQERGDTVAVADVATVVEALLATMTGDVTAEDVQLYKELEGLARYIHAARSEIAAINPGEIQSQFLPSASDELDAIVEATEKATNQIMDAAEVLEDLQGDLPAEAAERLAAATTAIYEACTFQDITGQRITKVVRTLKIIEDRVDGLVRAFDPSFDKTRAAPDATAADKPADPAAAAPEGPRKPTDEELLNGPQAVESAMRQDDIDALLASFD